jgi:hypothetical protein
MTNDLMIGWFWEPTHHMSGYESSHAMMRCMCSNDVPDERRLMTDDDDGDDDDDVLFCFLLSLFSSLRFLFLFFS